MNGLFIRWFTGALMTVLTIGPLPAQEAPGSVIEFTPDRWDLATARVVDHLDHNALIGMAFLKDVEFEDGVIECDIAMKGGARSYPGILFRVSPDGRATTILDTTAPRMNMADFAYDPDRNMVVFPTFTDSRLAAFRLGK